MQLVFAFEKASVAAAKSDISDVNAVEEVFPAAIGPLIPDVSKGILVASSDGVVDKGSVELTLGEGGGVGGAFCSKVDVCGACGSVLSKVRIIFSKPFKLGTK